MACHNSQLPKIAVKVKKEQQKAPAFGRGFLQRKLRNLVGLAGFGPAECRSQSPVPYHLATAQYRPGALPGGTKKANSKEFAFFVNGVGDGTRTHDTRNHNPMLYQLNYTYHNWCARRDSNPWPTA